MLHRYLDEAAERRPDHLAILEPGGESLRYQELKTLADRTRDRLRALGVSRGDRVGICVHKSIDTVAAILGTLRAGAAYVPVDPTAPAARNGFILADCDVRVAIVEKELASDLAAEIESNGSHPAIIEIGSPGGGRALNVALDEADAKSTAPVSATEENAPEDLAYILYTSGSTGKPKGVMLTHENAISFTEWGAQALHPTSEDRFSSHAPFHFDLSIFDLYQPLRAAATLVLITEAVGKEPQKLAQLIAETQISIWYSAPSILTFLSQYGKLEKYDYSKLRMVLFAGEVFPVGHLRGLQAEWPHPRYFNLYGPTETNVCTAYEVVGRVPEDRQHPYPIGKVCSHLEGVVVDPEGKEVSPGSEGELCIRGSGVMSGYWKRPELSEAAFIPFGEGAPYYRTGDIVVEESSGDYRYVGRRDRMVKKRGYRVELGEIEACLYRHPQIAEAAVIAHQDPEAGVSVLAHLAAKADEKLSIIALKRFCNENLPAYMVPDRFQFHPFLPKTSTDKIDYQTLKKRDSD